MGAAGGYVPLDGACGDSGIDDKEIGKSGFMEVLIYGFERCEYTVSRNKKPLS